MIAPDAPYSNARKGSVELEFDVLPDGTTANPIVLKSDASDAFVAAAKRTILRWRFLPAVVDGKVITSKRQWSLGFDNT